MNTKIENTQKDIDSLMVMGWKFKVSHFRLQNGDLMSYSRKKNYYFSELEPNARGGLTRVELFDPRGIYVGLGEAICSVKDNFCYKMGRLIASQRAINDAEEGGYNASSVELPKPRLTLEVGKHYILENGEKHKCDRIRNSDRYKFAIGGRSYTSDGFFYSDKRPNPFNVAREYDPRAELRLEEGKYYLLEKGKIEKCESRSSARFPYALGANVYTIDGYFWLDKSPNSLNVVSEVTITEVK